MITLLEKLIFKDSEDYTSSKARQTYGILCGSVGIFLNMLLFTGKFIAGTLTRSIAITADAFNNLSDAGSSIITLLGFKLAGQKPDPQHPFGHGRIEYLSGLMVSAAILFMGIELIKNSASKILHPADVEYTLLSIAVLMVSILVKLYMASYNKRIASKINSAAMKATAVDSLSDSLATSAVLISALIGKFTSLNLDGYCGILVGLFIIYAGFSAAKDTLSPLLGQPPEDSFVKDIEDIVMSYDVILGIHDLVVHDYGPGRVMLSLHAEVPASGNLMMLHDTIDNIEKELRARLHAEAVIHMDPVISDDDEINELKAMSLCILHSIDEEISMHDFRVVKGPTHTNIIFDVLVPYNFKLSDEVLKNTILEKVQAKNSSCFTVIDVDKSYNPH